MSNENDNLRDRHLLRLFLALNVGLAAAFVVYLAVSTRHQTHLTAAPAPAPARTAPASALKPALGPSTAPAPATPRADLGRAVGQNSAQAGDVSLPARRGSVTPLSSRSAGAAQTKTKPVTWEDVESPGYAVYLESLRAAGCPEDKVRAIALADINALFDQRRLQEAVAYDAHWWRPQADYMVSAALQDKGRRLVEQRRFLIERLLGPEALGDEASEPTLWNNMPLTGPVLGALSIEKHQAVQALCGQALERQQAAFWTGVQDGQAVSGVELARLREQTRADLRQALKPAELEEFMVRFTHVAHHLRIELAVLLPTEEEFRRAFRAVDPIDHQMQLDFGGVEAMSPQQREQYERQRQAALREALGPERHQALQLAQDPLFHQAQALAAQRKAPAQALLPIYQLHKAGETRRQQIRADATLSPEQKSQALEALQLEQQASLLRLVGEPAARPR